MSHLKTLLVLLIFVTVCYGQIGTIGNHNAAHKIHKKKKKHYLHYFHLLHYLGYLAIKLKIIFFLGTIFTIGLVAAKVVGIIKLTQYMQHKYDSHPKEEKLVYVSPHEHHDYGGHPGGYASSPDFGPTNSYPSYPPGFSIDHPPDAYTNDRYGGGQRTYQYAGSNRKIEENYAQGIYEQFKKIPDKLRQMNITDMVLNEMGINNEYCKRKFICKADYNGRHNVILRKALNFFRDISYERYKTNTTIMSEAECDSLYPQCEDQN